MIVRRVTRAGDEVQDIRRGRRPQETHPAELAGAQRAPSGDDARRVRSARRGPQRREEAVADSIYRVTEVIGTSTDSWEDAARHAVETAARTLRDLRVGEIVKLDVTIEDGRVTQYRARVNVSFKYESE
jgi:flavin-binding protein dodecin